MSADPLQEYGFTPVPSSAEKLIEQAVRHRGSPPAALVSATPIPDTPLARRIQTYARTHLPQPTFHHSMRVYHLGLAIKSHFFPEWRFSDETYFLACMLHDIGTSAESLGATHLSFEFYGGFLALDVLQRSDDGSETSAVSPKAQAESVAEAIIRHQDLCQVGSITAVGQLIQLATIFDNTGMHSQLVHADTVRDVNQQFPRLRWSGCFADTVRQEMQLKPWAHTTTLGEDDFPAKILGNPLAAEFE
ncbi:putative urea hydro-lyase/cyanamide hydratase [Aspergillus melleus]|uniref:putative urea hydro-lyase/cyanamide hydratase n=1 Tax=Aspergillus melleus TaxID=138277 RepID=UPI001E8D8CCB|nr:uncharacterized protein LDX57_002241 [Aspergillus melleus]KAH8424490.1 hypothetical protein LDX57_002241 [Aspergillus melleus]